VVSRWAILDDRREAVGKTNKPAPRRAGTATKKTRAEREIAIADGLLDLLETNPKAAERILKLLVSLVVESGHERN
jgi:hypothetical protein